MRTSKKRKSTFSAKDLRGFFWVGMSLLILGMLLVGAASAATPYNWEHPFKCLIDVAIAGVMIYYGIMFMTKSHWLWYQMPEEERRRT